MPIQRLGKVLPFLLVALLTACGGGGDDGEEPAAVNRPPAVNAGPDLFVDEGTVVTMSGTASDSDGSIASHRWEQTGGVSAPLSSVAGATATFTAPEVSADETLTFRLTVTDDDGARASDEVRVTVRQVEPNQPPAVNAGPDLFVDEGTVVTMSGTASDSDGSIASHRWEQTGGVSAPLSSVAGATATFTAPEVSADETLTFRLTVTDDDGARASDEVRVTVRQVEPNQPPAVNAGPDLFVDEGTVVTMSGTASDSDGRIVSHRWEQTGGVSAPLSSVAGAIATFTAPEVSADETLTFRLTVTDDDGAQASDEVQVTVVECYGSSDQSMDTNRPRMFTTGGQKVILQSVKTLPCRRIEAKYEWLQVAGPAVDLVGSRTEIAQFTAPSVDRETDLAFSLTAEYPGGVTISDTVPIRVIPRMTEKTLSALLDFTDVDTSDRPLNREDLVALLDTNVDSLRNFISKTSRGLVDVDFDILDWIKVDKEEPVQTWDIIDAMSEFADLSAYDKVLPVPLLWGVDTDVGQCSAFLNPAKWYTPNGTFELGAAWLGAPGCLDKHIIAHEYVRFAHF